MDEKKTRLHKSLSSKEITLPKPKIQGYYVFILVLAIIGYILLFSFISLSRYDAFDFHDFDLAIYGQVMWNILHVSIYSSILGVPFLGNHMDFILFLLIPIYALFQTPKTLLVIQTIFIAAGAFPLYLLAKDNLNRKFGLAFGILYLIYPALNFVNTFEFHPVAFTIPFLLFMIYWFEKKNFSLFFSFMVLAMLCKENISMAIFFFGLYVIFFTKRPLKWSLVPVTVSLFWFAITLTLMPYLNKGTIGFSFIYSHLGRTFPEIAWNIIKHPGFVLKLFFTSQNLNFLFKLFVPLAFISILSPKILFIAVPFFLQQLLSLRVEDHSINYHYIAKLIPFLFVAAIHGTKRLMKMRFINRFSSIFIGVLFTASLISNISFGFLFNKMPKRVSSYRLEDIDYEKESLIKKIPKGASVVTTFEFLPKLSSRKGLYSFHHVYIDRYTLSRKEYKLAEDAEYALIDFDDYLTFTSFYSLQNYKNIKQFLTKDKWGVVKARDNIALFKKNYQTGKQLYQPLVKFVPTSLKRLRVENGIVMLEYHIGNENVRSGEAIQMNFIWQCLKKIDKDYWVAIKLVSKDGQILHEYNHPICYRIYPTYAWKEGEVLREDYWILVPSKVTAKEAYLKIGIFDHASRKGVYTELTDASMIDKEGWINLGKITIGDSK